jgi:hypothetical protein
MELTGTLCWQNSELFYVKVGGAYSYYYASELLRLVRYVACMDRQMVGCKNEQLITGAYRVAGKWLHGLILN